MILIVNVDKTLILVKSVLGVSSKIKSGVFLSRFLGGSCPFNFAMEDLHSWS